MNEENRSYGQQSSYSQYGQNQYQSNGNGNGNDDEMWFII